MPGPTPIPPGFLRAGMGALSWTAAWLTGACSPAEAPADFGEALVFVDTNLPVPGVVSRLRIDVLTSHGHPLASRDVPTTAARQWPISFSVVGGTSAPTSVFLRLRAYLDGRTLPKRPATLDAGAADDPFNGSGEFAVPNPALAVDRIVRVELAKGVRGRVRVMLDGACVGIPAEVGVDGQPRTCVDGELRSEDALELPFEQSGLDDTLPTAAGTYMHTACTSETPPDRVCHPGGAFVFGDAYFQSARIVVAPLTPRPERVVVLSRFELDRDEYSVSRYRAALARGFVPPTEVGRWDAAFPDDSQRLDACSFSSSPMGREDYGLSCVTWETAQALCRFEGGRLPSEVEWEYAAVWAGRESKALYPWGSANPTCDAAVFGRVLVPSVCGDSGVGASVDVGAEDITPLGVRALAGRLTEFVRDNPAELSHPCWRAPGNRDPSCSLAPAPGCENPNNPECSRDPGLNHALRGGSWLSSPDELRPVDRSQATRTPAMSHNTIGFRCAYPVEPP